MWMKLARTGLAAVAGAAVLGVAAGQGEIEPIENCFVLTNLGRGCTLAPPPLNPGECVLATTTNIIVNGCASTAGAGKTICATTFKKVCVQNVGKFNNITGECDPYPEGTTVTVSTSTADASLAGDDCTGGGGGEN